MIGNFRPSQTKTHDLSNTQKSLRAFRTVPSRRVAAAPTKNSEIITCVYRQLKLGRSGDEVRPGWRVN